MLVNELIVRLMKQPGFAEVKVWVGTKPWGLEIDGLGTEANSGEVMILCGGSENGS